MIHLRKTTGTLDILAKLEKARASDNAGVYRSGPIYELIKTDFLGKCYLCEDDEATSIQIEHFEPHRGDLAKKYDWRNLFFSCGHCNNLKGDRYWPLLNCTELADQVWHSIEIRFTPFPKTKVEIKVHPIHGKERECDNTQRLLESSLADKASTAIKKDEAAVLRKKMLRVHDKLHAAIVQRDIEALKNVIADRAPFAGMCRWILRRDFPDMFNQLMPETGTRP